MSELLQEVQSELKEVRVEDVNVLFLDISSTCTGYSIFNVNFKNKTAVGTSAGAIWLPDVAHQKKYAYIYNAIVNYFNIVEKCDYIVAEAYNINHKKMSGALVSPEMHGACKAAAEEAGITFRTFLPQQWRKELKIKKTILGDFKEPCKEKVLELVEIPDKLISNITHNERNTPSDLYDAIGLGVGFLRKLELRHISFSQLKLQGHVGVLDDV